MEFEFITAFVVVLGLFMAVVIGIHHWKRYRRNKLWPFEEERSDDSF